MNVPVTLSMTGAQHQALWQHLFPGDDREAVAFLACNRRDGERRHRLIVREVVPVPHVECQHRGPSSVSWSTESIQLLLETAVEAEYSLVKVHSHPTGYPDFSVTDDQADEELLPAIQNWVEHDYPHGSAIMFKDGQMRGRYLNNGGRFEDIDSIAVVGDDLSFWYAEGPSRNAPDFVASHGQMFGRGTYDRLLRLSIAVIGASGTGGPLIDQLMRLGVGQLVLVDDDVVEHRNINRIPYSTLADAEQGRPKVELFAEVARATGLGTEVIVHAQNLWYEDVVHSVAQCDVVFGCMDSIDGRYLLNLLATYYSLPYIDIGVCLDTYRESDLKGQIREACGTVHYPQPGLSSLMSRGVFDMEAVRDAGRKRTDPESYDREVEEKYIRGVNEKQPAVISLNTFAASMAAMELLARIHPYRERPNCEYAAIEFSFAGAEQFPDAEPGPCSLISDAVGLGDRRVTLDITALSKKGDGDE